MKALNYTRAAALPETLKQRIVILDGAMGTMIQRFKLTEADYRGERFKDFPKDVKGNNELLSLTRPDIIRDIHEAYLAAGADNLQDPFNLVGRGDCLETASLMVMAGHLLPDDAYHCVAGAARAEPPKVTGALLDGAAIGGTVRTTAGVPVGGGGGIGSDTSSGGGGAAGADGGGARGGEGAWGRFFHRACDCVTFGR